MNSSRNPFAHILWVVSLVAANGACDGDEGGADPGRSDDDRARAADTVVEAPGDTGEGFGDSIRAVNGVRGGGRSQGGEDVFSLGYGEGTDNFVILRWSGRRVLNGPGTDFAVFENAFVIGSSTHQFMDPVIVQLSRDGAAWVDVPHDYLAGDEREYSANPADWLGFAGLQPVWLNEDSHRVDPFEPEAAGGDHFDLDDLPQDDPIAAAIRADGFVFIRLVTAPSQVNPDTGLPYPRDPVSTGADIDGVYARYVEDEEAGQ